MDNVQRILAVFDQNVRSTYELMNFDQVVMDYAIAVVKKLRETAELPYTKDKLIENALGSLENVRRNDSLRPGPSSH